MTANNKILGKIKSLLALANDASAAPNEAATALRQAQKLMEQHGLDQATIEAPTIDEQRIKASVKSRPTTWEIGLISMVAETFGASIIFMERMNSGEWAFSAPAPRAEVAAYVATVLLRKLKQARTTYIDTELKRVRKRANKISRADTFCRGWVSIVRKQAIKFAMPEAEQQAIEGYKARYVTESFTGRQGEKKPSANDFYHGWNAGRDVRLQHGVETDGRQTKAIGRD